MTTLYRPVLIESVEQAEALPIDTVARASWDRVAAKVGRNTWADNDYTNGRATDLGAVGWTALVPIEAKEEWAAEFDSGELYMNLDQDSARNADGGAAMSRYVTPWEHAS